jgi:hypothetical protein
MDDQKNIRRGDRYIRERRAFIDGMLEWLGEIQRSDLCAEFGISPQQAANDLRDYAEETGNSFYDSSSKAWKRADGFRPESTGGLHAFLQRHWNAGLRIQIERVTPPFTTAPAPIMQVLLTSHLKRKPVRVVYQSVSSPEPTERVICPHSLTEDRMILRIRAYCYKSREYRDFVATRIREASLEQRMPWVGSEDDAEWNSEVTVRIEPHPALKPSQAMMAMDEIGLPSFGGEFRMRQAHLIYFLDSMGLLICVRDGDGTPDKVNRYRCANARELKPLLPASAAS